jgi:hypothetical protein
MPADGVNVGEFHADPLGDDPFLAAGGDEQQVFLAVVVEAKVVRGAGGRLSRRHSQCSGRAVHRAGAFAIDEGAHAADRVSGDAPAEAEPADQLAVVHRQPPKGGLCHAGAAAEFGDVAQERFAQRTTSRMSLAGK